jgi:hypothetical protein
MSDSQIRSEGDWTLEQHDEGMYEVREDGSLRARIFTQDATSSEVLPDVELSQMTASITVDDDTDPEDEFETYVEDRAF